MIAGGGLTLGTSIPLTSIPLIGTSPIPLIGLTIVLGPA